MCQLPPEVPAGWQTLRSQPRSVYFNPHLPLFPSCVETLGAWGSCAHSLVQQIGPRVMEQTGDNRASQFLIQEIVIDVQRSNAASLMATIPSSQD